VADGLDAMLAFYAYDRGDGKRFELDITRQFVLDDGEDHPVDISVRSCCLHAGLAHGPRLRLRRVAVL
jgi:hypothetical protein